MRPRVGAASDGGVDLQPRDPVDGCSRQCWVLFGVPDEVRPGPARRVARNSRILRSSALTSTARGGTHPSSSPRSRPHLVIDTSIPPEAPVIRVKRPFRAVGMARAKAPDHVSRREDQTEARQGSRRSSPWRRKEVALGRLRTLTVILILGAWGAATEGASPDDAAARQPRRPASRRPCRRSSISRPGRRLFNSGQFDLAAKYLDAAQMYRDQLQADEQTRLDAYLKELAKVQAAAAVASRPRRRPGRRRPSAPAAGRSPRRPRPRRSVQTGDAARGRRPARCDVDAPDAKQQARWLLHEAREQIALGNYDAAEKKVAEAEAMNVKWGLFDDTPDEGPQRPGKARPKAVAAASSRLDPAGRPQGRQGQAQGGPRRAGQPPVRAGRGDRPGGQGLEPELRHLRGQPRQGRRRRPGPPPARQDPQHDAQGAAQPGRVRRPGPGIAAADASRQARRGRGQGRQAQRMNVVPSLTADRAEAVLHDIAMARAQTTAPRAPADGRPGSPSPPASWPSARPTSCWPRATRRRPRPSSPRPSGSGRTEAGAGAVAAAPQPALDPAVQKVARTSRPAACRLRRRRAPAARPRRPARRRST